VSYDKYDSVTFKATFTDDFQTVCTNYLLAAFKYAYNRRSV